MDILLDIAFQDAGTGRLVKAGGLEDVGGIDPVVLSTAHDMFFEVRSELVLVNGDLNGMD